MNSWNSLVLVAAAVMASVSCQVKETGITPDDTHTVTFLADQGQTKTYITGGDASAATFAWSEADCDNFSIYENDSEAIDYTASIDDDGRMVICAQFAGSAEYPSTYSAVFNGEVERDQTLREEGRYDERSEVLAAKTVVDASQDAVTFAFERVTAFNKVTLRGFAAGEAISSVKISADKALSGEYDYANGAWTSTAKSINLKQAESSSELPVPGQSICADADGRVTVLFSSIPVSEAALTISVTTAERQLEKVFAKPISLQQGSINSFSVMLEDVTGGDDGALTNSFVKVTSAPADWSGEYLIVYEDAAGSAKVFNGLDAAHDYVKASIADNAITLADGMAVVTIEAMTGGYSLKVSGGYLSGTSGSNKLNYSGSAQLNTISIAGNAEVTITSNTSVMRFNTTSGDSNDRFRYYKSSTTNFPLVNLYRKGAGASPAAPQVTTVAATEIGQTGATLSASYSGASAAPTELGFEWGTSSSALTNELYVDSGSATSGNFSKVLSSLAEGTTYYFRAYIVVAGKTYYGPVKSFTTGYSSVVPGDNTAYGSSWLAGYEIPATTASVSFDDVQYAGYYCNSTVSESYGDTKACIYNTTSASQRIVTHTFSYNGKVLPTYSMLYDENKHCALWEAFVMGGDDYRDKNVGRNDSWGYDPALPSSWQPYLKSSYSGYTRGHAIASNYRQTTTAQNKQTFYYSNMTPQASALNSGSWNVLENKVKGLGDQTTGTSRLYVVTGPVFGSGYKTCADASGMACPVPTQYYKCIMLCTFNANGSMATCKAAGYLFVHDGTSAPRQDVTVDAVEALTGFDFFANVPDSLESAAEASAYKFF